MENLKTFTAAGFFVTVDLISLFNDSIKKKSTGNLLFIVGIIFHFYLRLNIQLRL
jgi:hypothetical protein